MGSIICSVGTSCCSCLCNACSSSLDAPARLDRKLEHLSILIVAICIGLLLYYFGDDALSFLEFLGLTPITGQQAIYHESFSLAIIFLFILIFTLIDESIINRGCWTVKFLCFLCVCLLSFAMGDSFFEYYYTFAIYASVIFLIAQVLVVIDIAYTWNSNWFEKYEEGNNYSYYLIISTGIAWIGSIACTIFSFYWFTGTDCGENLWLIISSIILGVALTIFSISGYVDDGSLFTSSIINLYLIYSCWDALAGEYSHCNSISGPLTKIISLALSLLLMIVIAAYISLNQGASNEILSEDVEKPLLNRKTTQDPDLHIPVDTKSMIYFHLLMVFSSIYIAVLLTDWDSQNSNIGKWIKFSSLWLTAALYLWTMLSSFERH
ncbi:SERINC3_3 [Blepharisma stoltei]|uniref:Serine incorporator n=1 Tax=Blepharisma stoltei TaxID=1481888 RepID=A0AAU9JPW8_9CILI|nr:unnamed protein product [Blepharisma stoltei]